MIERKKLARIAMKLTEAIIGILKEELGDKDEDKQRPDNQVCEDNRPDFDRDPDSSDS